MNGDEEYCHMFDDQDDQSSRVDKIYEGRCLMGFPLRNVIKWEWVETKNLTRFLEE